MFEGFGLGRFGEEVAHADRGKLWAFYDAAPASEPLAAAGRKMLAAPSGGVTGGLIKVLAGVMKVMGGGAMFDLLAVQVSLWAHGVSIEDVKQVGLAGRRFVQSRVGRDLLHEALTSIKTVGSGALREVTSRHDRRADP